jgi:hypothetical protein
MQNKILHRMVCFSREVVDHICGRWVKILGENRFQTVILADIRLWSCDMPLTGCDGCRIKLCIEWCIFRGELFVIFVAYGLK